jgi:hypothetical protein
MLAVVVSCYVLSSKLLDICLEDVPVVEVEAWQLEEMRCDPGYLGHSKKVF